MIPTMNEDSRLADVIFGKRKLELRENAFSFLNETFIFEFYTSFSTIYQKIVLHFSSPLSDSTALSFVNPLNRFCEVLPVLET